MECVCQPTKEDIRKWLTERWQQRSPIPDAEQIRRQLGWDVARPHRRTPETSGAHERPHGPRPR